MNRFLGAKNLLSAVFFLIVTCVMPVANAAANPELIQANLKFEKYSKIAERIGSGERMSIIVTLQAPFVHEGELQNPQDVLKQRARVFEVQDKFISFMSRYGATKSAQKYAFSPKIVLEVDAAALSELLASPDVIDFEENISGAVALNHSAIVVQENYGKYNTSGYSGVGQTVAILDTGVNKNHQFLFNKVVDEACFSFNQLGAISLCPNGGVSQTGVGAAAPCTFSNECSHGTHVAGIAAGKNPSPHPGTGYPPNFGVAKDANILAVQVFAKYNTAAACGSAPVPCLRWQLSSLEQALDYVYSRRVSYKIAAVNLSLGNQVKYTSYCDVGFSSFKQKIDALRGIGTAATVSTGNNSFTDGLAFPACISSVIPVGASDINYGEYITYGFVAGFSNRWSAAILYAPGGQHVWSSVNYCCLPYGAMLGTSMAAPHVAGAWAVMKQKRPNATVDSVRSAFFGSGYYPISGTTTGKGLQLKSAINALP